jgi:hypothetical protein
MYKQECNMSKRLKSHTERLRQEVAIGSINDQEVKQIVFRQPEVVKAIQDLKEVFGKLLVKVYNPPGVDTDIIIPLVDIEALMGFLLSELSCFIQGSGNVRMMAKSFLHAEVFERDEEIDTELYNSVLDEIERLVGYLIRQLQSTDFDHHAPHSYDLVRILHGDGLLLIRASYRS